MNELANNIAEYIARNAENLSEADKILYQLHDLVLDKLEDNYDF